MWKLRVLKLIIFRALRALEAKEMREGLGHSVTDKQGVPGEGGTWAERAGGQPELFVGLPIPTGDSRLWGAHLVRDQCIWGFLLRRGAVLCRQDAGEWSGVLGAAHQWGLLWGGPCPSLPSSGLLARERPAGGCHQAQRAGLSWVYIQPGTLGKVLSCTQPQFFPL